MPNKRTAGALRILAAACMLTATASARAFEGSDLTVEGPGGSRFTLEVYERVRGEFVDWFGPGPPVDPRYDFFGHKFQLGVRARWKWLEAFLQYQQSLLVNVPDDGTGVGAVYFANTKRATQLGNFVRQGWARATHQLDRYQLSLQVGRILYSDGGETVAADPTLQWLKAKRIGQRLIGPFDYTHIGRSFDGGVAQLDHPAFNVTGFGFLPTTGGFEIDGGRTIPAIDVAGVSATWKQLAGLVDAEGRLFWIYYFDDRPRENGITVLDNRPPALLALDHDPLDLHTVGADLLRVHPAGPGLVDFLVWTAGQFGSWQSLTHRAWAYAFEAGYQMPAWWAKPWLRAGFFRSSGDDDPEDGLHETFFQILPTARLYAETPFYNLMNDQDLFGQLILRPLATVTTQVDLHWLRATEGRDFVYSGGGATKGDFFGYAGVPARGRRNLAYLVDLALSWKPVAWLEVASYYGHAFGQDVVSASFDKRALDYGYLEVVFRR
jgi:hypothetical protein